MAGSKHPKAKLNHTLLFISELFAKHNLSNWFIAYGTLLGIIRNNSCIDMDDDVDMMCDIGDYSKIKQILTENGFTFESLKNPNHISSKNGFTAEELKKMYIIKTKNSTEFTSVDFYMAVIDNKGNFNDAWNHVVWSECYATEDKNATEDKKLIEYEWCDTTLYLPNNHETKIVKRYGKNWKTPANTKGPLPRARIL